MAVFGIVGGEKAAVIDAAKATVDDAGSVVNIIYNIRTRIGDHKIGRQAFLHHKGMPAAPEAPDIFC